MLSSKQNHYTLVFLCADAFIVCTKVFFVPPLQCPLAMMYARLPGRRAMFMGPLGINVATGHLKDAQLQLILLCA